MVLEGEEGQEGPQGVEAVGEEEVRGKILPLSIDMVEAEGVEEEAEEMLGVTPAQS